MRDTCGQERECHPKHLKGYILTNKGEMGRRGRPPSSSFFESSIINSSYTSGKGVFDPIWPNRDCHGAMEMGKKHILKQGTSSQVSV